MKLKKHFVKIIFIFIIVLACKSFVSGSIVVLNGLTHEHTVDQGETFKGIIEVQNTANIERHVKAYQRDYLFDYTGESKHDVPGTVSRSNSGWITFNPELFVLGPGEKTTIEYEIKVPMGDSLTGTFWSVIMVEGIIPPDTTKSGKGVTINTAIRYAVQIVTNIGNSGTSDLQFLGLNLFKNDKVNILDVILQNTGERQLKPEISFEIFDEKGISAGIFKSERRKTFPGTSIKTSLPLEGIKPGKYAGVLVADCDENHVFGTNFSFEIQ